MKHLRSWVMGAAVGFAAVLGVAQSAHALPPETTSQNVAVDQTFTSYDWSIAKTASPTTGTLPIGHEGDVTYKLDITRAPISDPVKVDTDFSATINDVISCPTGFTCTYTPNVTSWNVTGPETITYTVTVHNVSAACGQTVQVKNVATLIESDHFTPRTGQATVDIYTGQCEEPVMGCSNTIGYWKNHAGFGPQADVVSVLLPQHLGNLGGPKTLNVLTTLTSTRVLAQNYYGSPSNGITKLYAQLLAVKLNIARGANGSAVSSAVTAADNFLAMYNWQNWNSLSKAQKDQVMAWQSLFDQYNNGVVGPGHCE